MLFENLLEKLGRPVVVHVVEALDRGVNKGIPRDRNCPGGAMHLRSGRRRQAQHPKSQQEFP